MKQKHRKTQTNVHALRTIRTHDRRVEQPEVRSSALCFMSSGIRSSVSSLEAGAQSGKCESVTALEADVPASLIVLLQQLFVVRAGHRIDETSLSADYLAPGSANKANKSPTLMNILLYGSVVSTAAS
jgi:hypothetical protein